MEAPQAIYLGPILVEACGKILSRKMTEKDVEYIRKDLLLEWLNEKIRDYWANDENTMGIYPYALEEVITKLNSL